ncbi:TetR/AcrR family transcriptional regulator [Labedella endophytica]|uniref:TetR/AcrR family transcriptional regulator n=1 Tax=Labedella endophytica TaxID=1523160 RepID=A0A3S0VE26_9MICO|nr:TetR/AcrR family transcriptional regulator [Labedella endophytica]RUQ98173.1 TetR/AcrR family transcriptional regulator [Labedella endophytica]
MAGRPRSFDRNTAILVAMEQFWRDGYEATTVAKLTEAMGITPPSLYAAFGDKDQLFHAAAACYVDAMTVGLEAALAEPTAFEAIRQMLYSSGEAHTDAGTPAGCFLTLEPRMAPQREALRQRFAERITQGITEGDVLPGTDAEQLAAYVMAVHTGMAARARDGGTTAEVLAIAEMGLQALTPNLVSTAS